MHLYFLTRGKTNVIEQWLKHLEGKFYPFNYKGERQLFEANLKKVELWEYVFPEEHADTVIKTVFDGQECFGLSAGGWQNSMALKMLQKTLGVKPIPPLNPKAIKMAMPDREGMHVVGIGIKEDKIVEDEETKTKHENL